MPAGSRRALKSRPAPTHTVVPAGYPMVSDGVKGKIRTGEGRVQGQEYR